MVKIWKFGQKLWTLYGDLCSQKFIWDKPIKKRLSYFRNFQMPTLADGPQLSVTMGPLKHCQEPTTQMFCVSVPRLENS